MDNQKSMWFCGVVTKEISATRRAHPMADLAALAASLGCEVEDDRDNATLYVHALGDMAWEEGSLSSLVTTYGVYGRATIGDRKRAVAEALQRLSEYGRPEFEYTA